MADCAYQITPEAPCVRVHGDYCYGAQNVTDLPICHTCHRGPEQTGVPKPLGFDVMMAAFRRDRAWS